MIENENIMLILKEKKNYLNKKPHGIHDTKVKDYFLYVLFDISQGVQIVKLFFFVHNPIGC